MSHPKLYILLLLLQPILNSYAQADSTLQALQQLPKKYISSIENKVEKYSSRISNKTEKTLEKLSRWENKIKTMLQRANPETANKLFADGQLTFSEALKKYKAGKSVAEGYKANYDKYRDELNTQLKYIEEKKELLDKRLLQPINNAKSQVTELEKNVENTEAMEKFIMERKKKLIDESIIILGKSKYLKRINKEVFYYAETLRNYKTIFSDPKEIETKLMGILAKNPAFQKFAQQNSQLANVFGFPVSFGGAPAGGSVPIVNGLASRASLQQYGLDNFSAINTGNLQQFIESKIPELSSGLGLLQAKLDGLKELKSKELPDFKYNSQRTKSFRKRLELGSDLQFGKRIQALPSSGNISLKLGYKLNDQSSAGIGMSYMMGLGQGWNKIHLSSEGIGMRTYVKWKLKKGFDIQGGGEWNYMIGFKKIAELKDFDSWQQSALLGLGKSISSGKKKKGTVQILFDFLYNKHQPVTQPFSLRYGYNF
jgi:hypothetical protein